MMRCKATTCFLLAIASSSALASTPGEKDVEDRFFAAYQKGSGGFDPKLRYLDAEILELGLIESALGNVVVRGMVQKTLLNNTQLIDRVEGGAFDYSNATDGRRPWQSPNPRKSLRTQAINLRLYSMAHTIFGGDRYLSAARSVFRYLAGSLAAQGGGFHEAGDDRVPTEENALAIAALDAYYRATGERHALETAILAADRMLEERLLPSGGFRNDGESEVSLAATIAMTRALRALPRTRFREEAERSLGVIAKFAHPYGGFADAAGARSVRLNIAVARMDRALHEHAMLYLTSNEALSSAKDSAAVLLANHHLRFEPITLAVQN